MDLNQPCYQPLSSPIWQDGHDRPFTPEESRNLTQLGVNILALTRANRHREADAIWARLGFDHCSAATGLAAAIIEDQLPPPTI